MRQGQQNRRNRGRNNNNNNNNQHHRRGQNPLTRNFESTGPDVKIRGTPAHIAEKYMALARDAQSSGDPVLAENYLQHAEHYNRIIMAYREQQIAQGVDPMSGQMMPRPRMGDPGMGDEMDDGEGGDDLGQPMIRGSEPQPRLPEAPRFEDRPQQRPQGGEGGGHRPQHHGNGQARERHGGGERGDYRSSEGRGDRGFDRHERRPRFDRQDRPDRPDRPERQDRGQDRNEMRSLPERGSEPEMQAEADAPRRRERSERPEREDRGVPHHEQPDFLRRPVRRPRREGEEAAPAPVTAVTDEQGRE